VTLATADFMNLIELMRNGSAVVDIAKTGIGNISRDAHGPVLS